MTVMNRSVLALTLLTLIFTHPFSDIQGFADPISSLVPGSILGLAIRDDGESLLAKKRSCPLSDEFCLVGCFLFVLFFVFAFVFLCFFGAIKI